MQILACLVSWTDSHRLHEVGTSESHGIQQVFSVGKPSFDSMCTGTTRHRGRDQRVQESNGRT